MSASPFVVGVEILPAPPEGAGAAAARIGVRTVFSDG
jgi:hypothetical protein